MPKVRNVTLPARGKHFRVQSQTSCSDINQTGHNLNGSVLISAPEWNDIQTSLQEGGLAGAALLCARRSAGVLTQRLPGRREPFLGGTCRLALVYSRVVAD